MGAHRSTHLSDLPLSGLPFMLPPSILLPLCCAPKMAPYVHVGAVILTGGHEGRGGEEHRRCILVLAAASRGLTSWLWLGCTGPTGCVWCRFQRFASAACVCAVERDGAVAVGAVCTTGGGFNVSMGAAQAQPRTCGISRSRVFPFCYAPPYTAIVRCES